MKRSIFSASERQPGLSWWQLCIVFVLAVLLFVALRWQPEAWLQRQIDSQARQHRIGLQYEHLRVDGFTVHLERVSIRVAGLPVPVNIDTLNISPAWASLLTGKPGVLVFSKNDKQHAAALLAWQDGLVAVHDLDADLDVALLQALWLQRLTLPVHVAGRIMLSGDILFNATSAMPVAGDVNMLWQSAATDVTGLDKPLGDYRLLLKAGDAKSKLWQWKLTGGSALKLSGQGAINASGTLPQQWGVNGQIRMESANNGNAVAAMLGSKVAVFKLSGNIMHPRLQSFAGNH